MKPIFPKVAKGNPKRVFPQAAKEGDKPISHAYPVLNTDLARDNVENDIPAADREDL